MFRIKVEEIKELIEALNQSNVDELILEKDGVKVTLRKVVTEITSLSEAEREKEQLVEVAKPEEKKEETVCPNGWKEIKSPMVGTFYRASAPDAPPYVEEGDLVEPGQTLCVLEAMKLFNELAAEERGIIRKICVENAQPVEYGQTLFLIEPVGENEN